VEIFKINVGKERGKGKTFFVIIFNMKGVIKFKFKTESIK